MKSIAMKTALMNFLKVLIMLAVGSALIFLCLIIPETGLFGTTLRILIYSVLINAVLFCTVAMTGHLYGGCVLAFAFPVIRYFVLGLFTPIMIVPEIIANCFMLLAYCMIAQKNDRLYRGIGLGAGALVKYLVLWLVVGKIVPKFMDAIILLQGDAGAEGYEQGIALARMESLSGQIIGVLLGALIAFFLVPLIWKFIPEPVRAVKEKPVKKDKAARQAEKAEKAVQKAQSKKESGDLPAKKKAAPTAGKGAAGARSSATQSSGSQVSGSRAAGARSSGSRAASTRSSGKRSERNGASR